MALPRALCWASTSLSQLADGMTYYSCLDFSILKMPYYNAFLSLFQIILLVYSDSKPETDELNAKPQRR